MRLPKQIGDLTEKEFELQAIGTKNAPGVARQVGFRCYHTLRSRGSEPGFPDWTLARERVVFLELKKEAGKLSPTQREWLTALLDAGAEAYVVRPRDLDDLARVLAQRGSPWDARGDLPGIASRLREQTRREADGKPAKPVSAQLEISDAA